MKLRNVLVDLTFRSHPDETDCLRFVIPLNAQLFSLKTF